MTATHITLSRLGAGADGPAADVVLVFGPRQAMTEAATFDAIRAQYPTARIAGASTGGEIIGQVVSDDTVAMTIIGLDQSSANISHVAVSSDQASDVHGKRLADSIAPHDAQGRPLAYVLVLADGIVLNGSSFARGLEAGLPSGTPVSGALAGDDDRFETSIVWADAVLDEPCAVAVAFYGERLRVGIGIGGGWSTFGIEREVTQSRDNVLSELDGRSALDLYKTYLGPAAESLPASGLRFPLAVRESGRDYELVRTLLGVDHEADTITFAGDVPIGATARMMRANPDSLVDGACRAAERAAEALEVTPQFALLVSCVGRKWTLGERTEEEVEGVSGVLGAVPMSGLYSYGELAPAADGSRCELHNQTMTITALAEI